jgi:phage terminase small subunit
MVAPVKLTAAQRAEAELKVDGPKRPGRKRVYTRDSLSKTKRGKNAIKKVEKIRIAALRKHAVDANTIKTIEAKNADRSLTEKQLMFVRLWAQGETPRTAAVLAGYSETSSNIAWKLTRDPAILKLYQAEKKEYEEAGKMTKKRVMDMFQEAYDHAKLISEPATMVAATREIAKMCGYYEPEKHLHIHANGRVIEQMNTMSDEELLEVMEKEGALEGVFKRLAEDSTTALPSPK